MNRLANQTAASMLQNLESRAISARELLDQHLEVVDSLNEDINAIVTLDVERATEQANEVDRQRASGEPLGPLAGLPMTLKDSISTQGLLTTAGSEMLAGYIPEHDADVAVRLKDAGAVIFGKTNVPEFAGDIQTYNKLFGVTNNPWSHEHTAGGSSGGAAAALATGMSALEVGSDIAGSIRIPASHCGVVGHKPSYGIVSQLGHIPGAPGSLSRSDLGVLGPMARTVEDCSLLLDVLAGPDRWCASGWELVLPKPSVTHVSDLKLAVCVENDYSPLSDDVHKSVLDIANDLHEQGATVGYDVIPPQLRLKEYASIYWDLLGSVLSQSYPPEIYDQIVASVEAGEIPPGGLALYGPQGVIIRHRDWLALNEARQKVRASFAEFFQQWDCILMPSSATAAIKHDHSEPLTERTIEVNGQEHNYVAQMSWILPASFAYLPATTVPIAKNSIGLPIGVQVVGPYLADKTCLEVGRMIEQISGGHAGLSNDVIL